MKKLWKEIKLFFLTKKLNYFLIKLKKITLRQKKYQIFLIKFKNAKSYFYLQSAKKYFVLLLFTTIFSYSIFYFYWKNKHSISIAIWTDYVTDEVVQKFEEETGWNVNVVTFSSNGELLNKLNSTKFDVIMPSDFITPMLYNSGYIQPFDITEIKKYQDEFSKEQEKNFTPIDSNFFYNNIIYNDHQNSMFQKLYFFDDLGKKNYFVQGPHNNQSFYYPFYPGTIQFAYNKDLFHCTLEELLKKYKINSKYPNFSLWSLLRSGMEDPDIKKPVLMSDDPRNIFGFSKTLRLIDCVNSITPNPECKSYFPYYPNETSAENDFLNFVNKEDVIKSFDLLEKIGLNKNVKFLGDEISTNISDKEFSMGFVYNGVVSYALSHKNNSIEGVNFNYFNKTKSDTDKLPNNVPFYTDGFTLGSNLSKEKKQISKKFISFATSFFSGYSTITNYSFLTLNFDSIVKYVENIYHIYQKEKDRNFLSNLLMLSSNEISTSGSPESFIKEYKNIFKSLIDNDFMLYTYSFDNDVNYFYNKFLTDKGANL